MKIKTILAFAVCLLAITSCKKEEKAPPSENQEPFAYLKTGHQWIYDFRYNGSLEDSLTITVVGEDNSVFEMFLQDAVSKSSSYQYVDGEYLRSFDYGQPKSTAVRVAKQNPKQGDTWTDFNGKDSLKYTVIATDLSITLPAGTYTCTEIETIYKKSGAKQIAYVNKTNGLMKLVVGSSSITAVYELRKKNF